MTYEAKAEDIRAVGAEDIGTSGMGEALSDYIYPYLDRGGLPPDLPALCTVTNIFSSFAFRVWDWALLLAWPYHAAGGCSWERVILWQGWKPVLARPLGLEIRPCDDWPQRVLTQVPGTLPGLLEVRMITCELSSMLRFIFKFHNSVSYSNIVFDSLVLSVGGFTMGMGLW